MSTAIVGKGERPTWPEVVLSFVPPHRRTHRAAVRLNRLPFALTLVAQAMLSWRLSAISNDDEALYIDTGHDIMAHLLHGTPLPDDYGAYLSGAPGLYPVIAAGLDSLGGLWLVRFFSLICVLTGSLCVYGIAHHLFNRRTALFSVVAFATTGSEIFVGKLATYDAPCLALVALSFYVAVTRRSLRSALLVGALLALAAATKYAGIAFVPFILTLGLLTDNVVYVGRTITRTLIGGLTAIGLLGIAYIEIGSSVTKGIIFTTTGRKPLDPQPYSVLLDSLLRDVAPLLVLLVTASALLWSRRRWRQLSITATCAVAGLFVPLSQLRIHEFTSLDKHTYFTGLFLAVPAGIALDWAFTSKVRVKIGALAVLWILLVDGMYRSNIQYNWSPATLQTVQVVEQHHIAGRYVSVDADTSRFYTHSASIRWQTSSFSYSFYAQPALVLSRAVRSHLFAGFVLRTDQMEGQRTMTRLLKADGDYALVGRYRTDKYHRDWYTVWLLTAAPAQSPSKHSTILVPQASRPTPRTAARLSQRLVKSSPQSTPTALLTLQPARHTHMHQGSGKRQ